LHLCTELHLIAIFRSAWLLLYFPHPPWNNEARSFSQGDVTPRDPSRSGQGHRTAVMSSSRFVFPHAYDPHMYREEVVTLARTTSQQNAVSKANGGPKPNSTSPKPAMASPSPVSTTKSAPKSPQRRKFVFADPVAFRYIFIRVKDWFSDQF